MDLTTLEGSDTPGKVTALCAKAIRPKPVRSDHPFLSRRSASTRHAWRMLSSTRGQQGARGLGVHRVSIRLRASCPSIKVAENRRTRSALGADEIDMVIDRGAFLSGRLPAPVYDEIVAVKEACGKAHLKVILETGELGSYDAVRRARHPRDGCRRRLHKDFDRQSAARGDPCRWSSGHDGGDPRFRPGGDRPAGWALKQREGYAPPSKSIAVLRPAPKRNPRFRLDDSLELFRAGVSTLLNDVLMQIRQGAHRRVPVPAITSRSTDGDHPRRVDRRLAPSRLEVRAGARSDRPRPHRAGVWAFHRRKGWFEPHSKKRFPTINRATEKKLAKCEEVSEADAVDVDRAVQSAAGEAFANGCRRCPAPSAPSTVPHRADPAGARARVRGGRDARWRQADQGVARRRYPARRGALLLLRGLGGQARWAFPNRRPKPLGVAGQIIPRNFPPQMLAWKIAPALAAGTRSC